MCQNIDFFLFSMLLNENNFSYKLFYRKFILYMYFSIEKLKTFYSSLYQIYTSYFFSFKGGFLKLKIVIDFLYFLHFSCKKLIVFHPLASGTTITITATNSVCNPIKIGISIYKSKSNKHSAEVFFSFCHFENFYGQNLN